MDTYVVFISPMVDTIMGFNPYILGAFERGLPAVMTVKSAEGICAECADLSTWNPQDPFKPPRNLPFLVANMNDLYDFVAKVKRFHYEPDLWKNYSTHVLSEPVHRFFSRYRAGIDFDSFIGDCFSDKKGRLKYHEPKN